MTDTTFAVEAVPDGACEPSGEQEPRTGAGALPETGWPRKSDRPLVGELFTLGFVVEGANVVLLGPNGVGKTMLLRNLADCALNAGHAVVVRTASDLLADLSKQESSEARARRLAAYVRAHLLCIDGVGYLSYDARDVSTATKSSFAPPTQGHSQPPRRH